MHSSLTILTETANAVSLTDAASDPAYVIGTSAHTHNLSSAPWNAIAIGSNATAVPAPGSVVIGSNAWAAPGGSIAFGSHTHTMTGVPTAEALPDGASVRFRIGDKDYTGEIVSSDATGFGGPVYVVQPDTALPKTGTKPIVRYHAQIERITFLQRFTEAVWAEG